MPSKNEDFLEKKKAWNNVLSSRASGSSFFCFLFHVFLWFFAFRAPACVDAFPCLGGAAELGTFFFLSFLSFLPLFSVFSERFFVTFFLSFLLWKIVFLVCFVVFRFGAFFLRRGGFFPFCRVAGALQLHAPSSVRRFSGGGISFFSIIKFLLGPSTRLCRIAFFLFVARVGAIFWVEEEGLFLLSCHF